MGRALLVAFWLTLGALVVHNLFRDLDVFGIAHVVYLAIVVTIPVAAGVLLAIGVRRLRTTNRQLARRNVAALLVAMLPAPLGYYATHIEPDRLITDRHTIAIADLAQPLKVAVLSDLQSPNIGDHERRAFAAVLDAEADLVVIPGDLWSGGAAQYPQVANELVELLGQLTANHGHVVMVAGDTDSPAQLRELAAATDAVFLDNQVWRHDINGQQITVVGTALPVGDASDIDDQLQLEISLLDPGELNILLTHRPDAALSLGETAPIDVIIAGHTHGGQIALPFVGPLVTLTEVPRQAARGGAMLIDDRALYVSAGVGIERNQAPQIRFGVPPEIGVLDLTAG